MLNPVAEPLLHNMSMRPHTRVSWRIESVEGEAVAFSLRRTLGGWVGPDPGALRAETLTDRASRDVTNRIDKAWRGWDLAGAMFVYSAPAEGDDAPARWATDPRLVLNVLARTRGDLLMARSRAFVQPDFLDRELATTDPRLVALAVLTGIATSEDTP